MPRHLGKRHLLVFPVPENLSPLARLSQCSVSIVLGSTLCLISLISYHRPKTQPWTMCSKSCVVPLCCLSADCWLLKDFHCDTSCGLLLPLSKCMQAYRHSVGVSSSLFPHIRGSLQTPFPLTIQNLLAGSWDYISHPGSSYLAFASLTNHFLLMLLSDSLVFDSGHDICSLISQIWLNPMPSLGS